MDGLSNDTSLYDEYIDGPKLTEQETHLSIEPVLRNSSDLNIRNRRFSSLLLRQNRSKPLRFFHCFDRFSSVFKRKNRRFLPF